MEGTMRTTLIQELTAEAIGTFGLVFAGTGAIMANAASGGAITHVGVAITFGAVVAALIYTFGHVSGAQMNHAVTLGFWASRSLPAKKVLPYVTAQLVGAIAASAVLFASFGNIANMGATLPLNDNWQQSLVLEIVLTFFLMIVILGSGLDRRSPSGFAGIAIGGTVMLEAMSMGPITGASMNPARSLSPALVGDVWQHQWLYWVAPVVGAQLAVLVYRVIAPVAFPSRNRDVVPVSVSGVTHEHRSEGSVAV
jgi:MIP family channel proteins